MRQSPKGEGTKIAQAAKDLNVTSVTIRRYISEFNIETTSDENGIKVLPERAMEELQEIRRLKEEGLTNPKVLEHLEEMRLKADKPSKGKKEAEPKKPTAKRVTEAAKVVEPPKKEVARRVERKVTRKEEVAPAAPVDDDEVEEEAKPVRPRADKPRANRVAKPRDLDAEEAVEPTGAEDSEEKEDGDVVDLGDGKSKHTLTCQTCSKTFEHMNPRLRDCLECYRAKRKERRRGGDKHKNVIQHPLAQQVANKQAQRQDENGGIESAERPERAERAERAPRGDRAERGERPERGDRYERGERPERGERGDRPDRGDRGGRPDRMDRGDSTIDATPPSSRDAGQIVTPLPLSSKRINPLSGMQRQAPVRNYRKAIEDTRQYTANLKRRLERPDLPENERRWLEQIYAYQLILHQGWRHLAEYKAGNQPPSKSET